MKDSIQALLKPYLDNEYPNLLPARLKSKAAYSETDVVVLASTAFEIPTENILDYVFGISGEFKSHRPIVNIGNPDRVFHLTETPAPQPNVFAVAKARFAVEFKTPWALPLPTNLRDVFNENKSNPRNKYTKAIQQLYGYLSFNNLEFGVLSNYDSTFFFRRVSDQGMEVSPVFRYSDTGLGSTVAALTYLCHYTATQQWFSCSPLASISPSTKQYLLDFDPGMEFVNDDEPMLDWGNLMLRLEIRIAKQIASIMTGFVSNKRGGSVLQHVVFKIYDLTDLEVARQSCQELTAYKECRTLQGTHIPKLYAVGTVWGLLRVFVMEHCGTALEGETLSRGDWEKAKVIIEKLHDCGITHGDLKPDNFVVSGQGQMRLIDLGLATKHPISDEDSFLREKENFEKLREV